MSSGDAPASAPGCGVSTAEAAMITAGSGTHEGGHRPRPRPLPYPRQGPAAGPSFLGQVAVVRAAVRGERRADRLPLPRWLGPLAVGSLIAFLPWIVYLGFTLPQRASAEHYDIAWLGFDSAMWTLLAVLAWAALRRHPATGPVAAMASLMLLTDAWFDIFTSSAEHGELVLAIVLALFGELPLAILCAWVAVHAERIRSRSYRSLQMRWERAVRATDEAISAQSRRSVPRPR